MTSWTVPLGSTICALTCRSACWPGGLERQVDGADPAGQRPAHFLGRNDEPDRVDGPNLGHSHADELARLLLDDRAAAVARLKRAVDLEQVNLPVLVATKRAIPPRVIVTDGLPLLSVTLPSMPPSGKPARGVGHAFGRLRFGEHVDRRGGPLHTLDDRNARSVLKSSEVSAAMIWAGSDCSFCGPWPLRKTASSSILLPLGTRLGGTLGEIEHRDVAIGRHHDGVAPHLDHKARTGRQCPCRQPCS